MRSISIRRHFTIAAALFLVGSVALAHEPATPEPVRVPRGDIPVEVLGDLEVASRPPVACDLPPQTFTRSLWSSNQWPGGTVPYEFNANVTTGNRNAMRLAMDELEGVCNVQFVARSGQANYLHIQNSTGNNSFIGMIGGGQTVNIFNWNFKFIMCHELMHALGMWHEQQRSDRGSYVTINSGNIQSGFAGNFSIAGATPLGTYDFDSVMHYDACSFSTCCPAGSTCSCPSNCVTIQALPQYAQYQNLMGQRTHLSDGDKNGLMQRYGSSLCPSVVSAPQSHAACEPTFIVSLQAEVSGPNLTYQWSLNGQPLADALPYQGVNTPNLLIVEGTPVHNGTYFLTATNSCRTVSTSATFNISNNGPVLPVALPNRVARLGEQVRFEIAAYGRAPIAYQWRKNGVPLVSSATISGVTTSTLLISSATDADAGTYTCAVSDACGGPVVSSAGTLAISCDESWQLAQPPAFGARFGAAVAYDSKRKRVLVFGGSYNDIPFGSETFNDTWEWDGANWLNKEPANPPSARLYSSMVYDGVRDRYVLFGGFPYSGETWVFTPGDGTGPSGGSWQNLGIVNGPSPRYGHGMAFDAKRGKTVLFGGVVNGSGVNGETWEYDGLSTWTNTGVTGPSPRLVGRQMAYDADVRWTVLFGGDQSPAAGSSNETWAFNGVSWFNLSSAARPPACWSGVLVYDRARSRMVLMGGICSPDTWEFGNTWVARPGVGPTGRYDSFGVYDEALNKVMCWGGWNNTTYNETWIRSSTFSPSFSQHPSDQSLAPGQTAMFMGAASGSGAITYLWRKDGTTLLTDGGRISGALTPTLTITACTPADAGTYQLLATNACATTPSNAATLSIPACLADFNNSGAVTVQDLFDYLAAWFARTPNADINNSGMVTVQDLFDFLALWFARC